MSDLDKLKEENRLMRAALRDVEHYSENDPWREKHKAILRVVGAWMGRADPHHLAFEEARAALKRGEIQ
jgi:hypothetical protein